ncbi:hypothetical protein [Nitrospirillum sp. BR 11828]|uniref:hypothetical protein n=1 Tax=Nitrospirillum sp. BR 11828 TaxID=3104325 RepID=UPI002ACACD6B|nr:hypothetical protein [Nitrospirillum sp. BR 11828]MDZ5648947.1 hypothetical protein [Nitrospirillum sp. BR 11828]
MMGLVIFIAACVPTWSKQASAAIAPSGSGDISPESALIRDPQRLSLLQHQDAIRSGRERPGCINFPAVQCIASLGITMFTDLTFTRSQGQSLLGDDPVAPGARIRPKTIIYLNASVNDKPYLDVFGVTLNTDDSEYRYVDSINIDLRDLAILLESVKSPDEIRVFRLYRIFYPILTTACPDLSEDYLNDFIYNKIIKNYANYGYFQKICGVRVKYEEKKFTITEDY